jgi:hypothetical protein
MIALGGQLAILTSGSEWMLRAGNNQDAVGATSMRLDVQSYRGCSHVPPLAVGSTVLFNSRDGQTVYDFGYFYASDRYETNDMCVIAHHLFENRTIKAWAYQQRPNSVVWCVMSDGTLLSFTFLKEHEVWAWAQHSTLGSVESISSIPGMGTYDEVALLVKRNINNADIYYVEVLAERLPDEDAAQGIFMDSARTTIATENTGTLSGMEHLEGKEVYVLDNGAVIKGLYVIGGRVTLPYVIPSGHRVICGLPIPTPTLELLPLEDEAAVGRKRRISKVIVRVENTRSLWIGPHEGNMVEAKWRTTEPYGSPPAMFTGDKEILIPTSWDLQTSLVIQQRDPLPQTISAVIPGVDFGG